MSSLNHFVFFYLNLDCLKNVERRLLSHIDITHFLQLIPQYVPSFSTEIVPDLQGFT
jgi:hypothetical protein